MNLPQISFGDKVRLRATPATESRGIAGRTGIVHGFTTPSQTGVEVIGDFADDYAIAVMVEGKNQRDVVRREPFGIIGSSTRHDSGNWQSSLDS